MIVSVLPSYKLDGKTLTITQELKPDRADSESDNVEADAKSNDVCEILTANKLRRFVGSEVGIRITRDSCDVSFLRSIVGLEPAAVRVMFKMSGHRTAAGSIAFC